MLSDTSTPDQERSVVLFVIGTQKGGTTFLRHLLFQHQNLGTKSVSGSPLEAHFWPRTWTRNETIGETQQREIADLAIGASIKPKAKHLFDTTPDYLAQLDGAVIQRIRITAPLASAVAVLRDPTERLVSAIAMTACALGTLQNQCLQTGKIWQRIPRSADATPPTDWTFQYGLYARHLERWRRGGFHVRVFFSEDLKRYPLDTVNAILAIAGLCPLNHIDVSVTKPVAQERCKFALCGAPARIDIEAQARQHCEQLHNLYAPENMRLARITQSMIPLAWSTCDHKNKSRVLRAPEAL